MVAGERADGVRESADVVRRDEQAGPAVVDDLGVAADVGGDDGPSGAHRFDQRE